MIRMRWILAGSTAALAGAFALSLAPTPIMTAPVAATAAPDPVSAPAPVAVAARSVVTPIAAAPLQRVPRTTIATPAPGVVPGSAGMVIAIDPETGATGLPTDAQMGELKIHEDEVVSRSADGLVPVSHANGAVSVNLQGRFQDYAIIRRSTNGTVTFGCIDNPADIEHAQTAPTALEEE